MTTSETCHVFRSDCGCFGVRIKDTLFQELVVHCKSASGVETGGILVGKYLETNSCAEITWITGPPPDSKHWASQFFRGVAGLQKLLDRFWNSQKTYYLGEWHFHPCDCNIASPTDLHQMKQIAENDRYACPEPILIIVSVKRGKYGLGVSVHFSNRAMMNLRTLEED